MNIDGEAACLLTLTRSETRATFLPSPHDLACTTMANVLCGALVALLPSSVVTCRAPTKAQPLRSVHVA